jgi:WD40 repeat protein
VTTGTGTAEYSVATDGTLVYVDTPGSLAANQRTLVWVDRTGKEEPLPAPPRAYNHPRLSPDGKRVASASDKTVRMWNVENSVEELCLDLKGINSVAYSPDGQSIVTVGYSDMTVFLHEEIVGHRKRTIEHVWPIAARGKLR